MEPGDAWPLDFGPSAIVTSFCDFEDLVMLLHTSQYFVQIISRNFFTIIANYVYRDVYIDGLYHPAVGGREGTTGKHMHFVLQRCSSKRIRILACQARSSKESHPAID